MHHHQINGKMMKKKWGEQNNQGAQDMIAQIQSCTAIRMGQTNGESAFISPLRK